MISLVKRFSLIFSAGAFGGMANALAVWLFGALGITAALGVNIAPALEPQLLYGKIVWGGIWGVLLLLPFGRARTWLKGLVVSLGPTLVQLFVVFPLRAGKGIMGLDLGMLTPAFVIFYNALWGIAAAYWYRASE
jgi:hypothetical protein